MSKKLLSGPYIVWMVGFTLIPLALIVFYGLTDKAGAFTLENIMAIAQPERFKRAASLAEAVPGEHGHLPGAGLSPGHDLKKPEGGKGSFIVFIFILPMWMNFLLRTMAWQTLLDHNGVINNILRFFNLPELKIINTQAAIIFGMVYNFLPFMVLPIYNVLVKIGDDTVEAARDLGANSVQTFFRVILPLSMPGVISGITMVFVPALTTFVISDLLGGGMILLIGNVIEQEFTFTTNWNLGSGLSLVLMVFILISMAILAKYDKEGEGAAF